jgi:hypothetical protein
VSKYIICLHDLKDLSFFATEDEALFNEACNTSDLMEFVWDEENYSKLEELGDDLTGVTVLGLTYGLMY